VVHGTMGEGDPQILKGTPTYHQKEEKEEQKWEERNDKTHNHKLGDTDPDTAVHQGVEAHMLEGMSNFVGEASPLEYREDTPTYLQRNPVLGAEHRRGGQCSGTSRTVTKSREKRFTLFLLTNK